MRRDTAGFFWDDTPPPKPPKAEKAKRTPPARTWESDDYLPHLEESLKFDVPIFSDSELLRAAEEREELLYDVEVYPNYFLASFLSRQSGKVAYVESMPGYPLNIAKLYWILTNFCTIGFNSISYDLVITALALAGRTEQELWAVTERIIAFEENGRDILKEMKVKNLRLNHIDLIEVAPLRGSLKIYAGRLHANRMQDLPFKPGTYLNANQIAITRWYNINDLRNTGYLRDALEEQLALRITLSTENGIDLRSKSDAQIAEAVIADSIAQLNGVRPKRPEMVPGTQYHYKPQGFLSYYSDTLNWVYELVKNTTFTVSAFGNIEKPESLKNLQFQIADATYTMGIGGLHSTETCKSYVAGDDYILCDVDMTSFYPFIILNQGLYPQHLGRNFLRVYKQIVDRRLHAKRMSGEAKKAEDKAGAAAWKVIADSLKITINGSYGKLGSMYSVLYAPDLLIQVTLTGQLALLTMIERFELAGIRVVSANTDGIAVLCHRSLRPVMDQIVKEWSAATNFEPEETPYSAMYIRDVNNYMAFKSDGSVKGKGALANHWRPDSEKSLRLSKNPQNAICIDAAIEKIKNNTPVEHTVTTCTDIRAFVTIRTVRGGAVTAGQYLGSAVRWYHASGEQPEIIYAKTGNRVAMSEGAKPLMDLPGELPNDMDYQWYIDETYKILRQISYMQ